MKHCETCRWWRKGSWNATFGVCKKLSFPEDKRSDGGVAWLSVDEPYCGADLNTKPHFGCVLHEEKPSC